MDMVREALARAQWVSGPAFRYGPDEAGYYDEKDEGHRTHVVSRGFELPAGWAAAGGVTLAVAVLGLARVRVNGRALGDFELMGYWTRYDRLVYYDTLDVSDCLRAGENTIEIELGNGFYNPAPLTLFGKYNLRERLAEVGTPQVAAALVQGGRAAPGDRRHLEALLRPAPLQQPLPGRGARPRVRARRGGPRHGGRGGGVSGAGPLAGAALPPVRRRGARVRHGGPRHDS